MIYPHLQDYTKIRGGNMPKKVLEYEQYKLQEKYLWFVGDEDLLADYYQTNTSSFGVINTRASYYYTNVTDKVRVVHSGMPSLISHGKARLVTNSDVEISVINGKDVDEKQTELLNVILEDNSFDRLLYTSILIQSWAIRFAWKIGYDKNLTKYPLIEKYTPFNYETIEERGRALGYIFKTDYGECNEKYQLHEIYTSGLIDYKLYKIVRNELVDVPLTTLEETKELEPFKFKGNFIMAGEFKGIKSDYDGVIAEFDALDEAWSQLMDEIRTGRAEVYVPEVLATGKKFDDFRKKYVVTGTDPRENGKNEISHNQSAIRTDEYTKAINSITYNILANAGLNPLTIGINDEAGANASQEALMQREVTSLRTRKSLVKVFEEFLVPMCNKILKADDVFNKRTPVDRELSVSFGEYIPPDRNTRIEQTAKMVDFDIIDQEKALDDIYGEELTEDEKSRILRNMGEQILIPEEEVKE